MPNFPKEWGNNFYKSGWDQKNGSTEDAKRWEDLRKYSRDYVSKCRLRIFKYIPKNEFYDMTQLFDELIVAGKEVHAFPLHEKWIDIGQFSDLKKANELEK